MVALELVHLQFAGGHVSFFGRLGAVALAPATIPMPRLGGAMPRVQAESSESCHGQWAVRRVRCRLVPGHWPIAWNLSQEPSKKKCSHTICWCLLMHKLQTSSTCCLLLEGLAMTSSGLFFAGRPKRGLPGIFALSKSQEEWICKYNRIMEPMGKSWMEHLYNRYIL